MSTLSARNHGKAPSQDTVNMFLMAGAFGLLVGIYWIWKLGYQIEGKPTEKLLHRIVGGDAPWVMTSTWLAVAGAVILFALMALFFWAYGKAQGRTKGGERIDQAAKHMAGPTEYKRLTEKGRKAHAKAMKVTHEPMNLGKAVNGGQDIHVGLEDTLTAIMGPRAGKSSSYAIPTIMEAKGKVLATSNKRDIIDATRAHRLKCGTVWVFDPQDLIGETPAWYWDPINYVNQGKATKRDSRARKLAAHFAFAFGGASGKREYFDQAAEAMLGQLILAAAVSGEPITTVRRWITKPNDPTPALALKAAGFAYSADALDSVQHLTPKQRDGVFHTADAMTMFLTFESIQPWIAPTGPSDRRPQFDPEQFVKGGGADTLYSISMEGHDSMSPIVTALTVAVVEAAERHAQSFRNGRLPVTMRLVLDEIANVCKWEDLPSKYSHFGSKGIIPFAFLQSWPQGVDLWGDSGMRALFGQSTLRLVGPGTFDHGFTDSIAEMVGETGLASHSTSYAERTGSSHSVQSEVTKIFGAADIGAIPTGRAVLFPAGGRAILLKSIQAKDRGYKDLGEVFEDEHEPSVDTAPIPRVSLNVPAAQNAPVKRGSTSRWIS